MSYDPARGYETEINGSRVLIGPYTYGFDKMRVETWGEGANLIIGKYCSIARDVKVLLGGNHRVDWFTTFPFGHVWESQMRIPQASGHPATRGDVHIGCDVWVGLGATILSGVEIGHGAVIGAGSIVASDVPAYGIAVGNPATLKRKRFDDSLISRLLEIQWWDLPEDKLRLIASDLCVIADHESLDMIERKLAQNERPGL